MGDSSRLKLILVGLILAGIVGGYFLYTQATKISKNAQVSDVQQFVPGRVVSASPLPSPTVLGQANKLSLAQTTKGGQPPSQVPIKTLPATGAPGDLMAIFSLSAAIIGWGLRKYPN